ncbi:MAG: cytochrome c [Bauldia sp.]|nr:cytochrome c [Bauldia sp.]MCW5716318.1 cytochrome c [Bauldia sp.]
MTEPELTEEGPVDLVAGPAVADPVPAAPDPAVTPAPAPAAPDAAAAPAAVAAAETPPPADPGPATVVAGAVEAPREVARGPGLGAPATAEEIARLNISIPPDGRNLPPGRGTSAEGALVFAQQCVACHGSRGAGGDGMVTLTGGLGTLTTERPVKTVSSFWPHATTLFDYIRRAMPLNAPQSLTDDQVYAVVAYLLSVDDIIPIGTVLDQTTLPLVEMPNRDGFVNWWPEPAAARN